MEKKKSYGSKGPNKGRKTDGKFKKGPRRGTSSSRFMQKKVCRFCTDRAVAIDFKDSDKLRRFLTEKGKILPARITGTCSKHQRMLSCAIKTSRQAALLPFQVA